MTAPKRPLAGKKQTRVKAWKLACDRTLRHELARLEWLMKEPRGYEPLLSFPQYVRDEFVRLAREAIENELRARAASAKEE